MSRITHQLRVSFALFSAFELGLFILPELSQAGVFTVLKDDVRETVIEISLPDWEQCRFDDGLLHLPVGSGVDCREGMRLTPYFSRLLVLPSARLPQVVVEEERWGDYQPGLAPWGDEPRDNLPVPLLEGRGPVVLSEPFEWRHRNAAHLFVVPMREQEGGVIPLTYLRFRIVYPQAGGGLRNAPDHLVSVGSLNGKAAQSWAMQRPAGGGGTIASMFAWPDGVMVRIEIEQEGIYELTRAGLQARGIDVSGYDPRKFRIYNNGGQRLPTSPTASRPVELIENAILVTGEADGSFDESDRIIFYGRSVNTWLPGATPGTFVHTNNPFTRRNVYWLELADSGPDGKRMDSLEPQTAVTFESTTARSRLFIDNDIVIYNSNSNPESGLDWYASELLGGEQYSTSFDVEHPLAQAEATVWVMFRTISGYTNQAVISVNNTVLDTISLNSERRSLTIPDHVLQNGSNTFSYRLLSGHVFFDAIELDYKRELRTSAGRLDFDAFDQDGVARITLEGMDNPWVFDVQDYANVTYAHNQTISLSSQVNTPHRRIAVENGEMLTPADVRQDGLGAPDYPNGLRDPGLAVPTIYIYHSDFDAAAKQLAAYVEQRDQKDILCVNIDDVFQEFAWGLYDPVAIRDFLMYAYYNWEVTPETVLLIGDGDYDYRNITSSADNNWIPPYEDGQICRDYWYVQFSDNDITQIQMVMGRLPVQTNTELTIFLDKLQRYENDSDLGSWRSRLVMVADDEYVDTGPALQEQIHMQQAEEFATEAAPDFITVKKIYIGTYPTTFDPATGGRRKPAATGALLNEINRGALMVSYIGHGNAHVWAHEAVLLDTRDNPLINSGDRTPLYLAATCSWGHFDRPVNQSHPEQLLVREGGAIGAVAASRVTNAYSNNRFALAFYARVFDREADLSAGEALYLALIDHPDGTNQYYHYFGEPDMRLALPNLDVELTDVEPDSLTALSTARVSGEVSTPDGVPLPDFDGEALVTVYDGADTLTYVFVDSNGNPADSLNYQVSGGTLFRGLVSTVAGELSAQFIVPRDVKYGSRNGSVHMYAFNDETDGVGSTGGVRISTQSAPSDDQTPPSITVYFDYPNWREGDLTSASPTLYVQLADSSGINLTGDIGHDIRADIDSDREILLTETFTYERDSYTTGAAAEQLYDLTPGKHALEVWAWDNANNFARVQTSFMVVDADQALALNNVLNWPNPFGERTSFTFELSTDAEVTIKIFTASGRKLRQIGPLPCHAGFNYPADGASRELEWDGRDDYGDPVANGAYLYQVKASAVSGQSDEVVGKLLRIR